MENKQVYNTIAALENMVRDDEHIDAPNENGQDEGDVVTVPTEQGDNIVPVENGKVAAVVPEEHEEIMDHSGLHGKH